MYNNCVMYFKGKFSIPLVYLFPVVCVCLLSMTVSCQDVKQAANEKWVDSILHVCDTMKADTLFSEEPEAEPSVTVDENFNDFLFTFLHNSNFQSQRIVLPLPVCNIVEVGGTSIRTLQDFSALMQDVDKDYYVLLLDNLDELDSAPLDAASQARVHVVDLASEQVNSFSCSRDDGLWKIQSLVRHTLVTFAYADFMYFYRRFASDSIYQAAHVAHPLTVCLEDEEGEGDIIEGTIDADQFPAFSPVLPSGRFMIIEYGTVTDDDGTRQRDSGTGILDRRCVMAKCGIGNGMMDILTFEKGTEEWKLTEIEN